MSQQVSRDDREGLLVAGAGGSDPRSLCSEESVRLVRHSNATGGVLLLAGEPQRLTPIQYSLLEILSNQALEDAEKPEAVRGYISSYELLCALPWDARAPEEGHLKQLVRRMRRRLCDSGLTLEARQGLGYRLTFARMQRTQANRAAVVDMPEREAPCEGCHGAPATVRFLCEPCARLLAPPLATLPEHVLSATIEHPDAWLADGWGCCHPLTSQLRVGRGSDCHIRILDCSVSRDHAEFFRQNGAWHCRDLGSRNGTFVDGKVCSAEDQVQHGSIVRFGQLAFMLLSELSSPRVFERRCALTSRLGG